MSYKTPYVIEQQGPEEFVVWSNFGGGPSVDTFETIEEAREAYPGAEEDSSWDPESDGGPSDAACRAEERRQMGFDF